jgi:NADPH:quinone reductase-like Zn-dependent oxidoreductase
VKILMRASRAIAALLLQLAARHPKMASFAPDGEFAPVETPYHAETSTAPALFDLTGKTALVTGGNGGIGSGIARGLAEAGADIIIIQIPGEKSPFPEQLAADTGRRVNTYDCDLASSKAIRSTVDRILVQGARTVDILANVAGISGGFVPILTETDAHRELVRNLSSSLAK